MNESSYPLTVYFDGACRLCRGEITNLALRDAHGRLRFVDASVPGFTAGPPGVPTARLLEIIHAVRPDGRVVSGVEVFHLAYEAVGLDWVSRVLRLPGIAMVARSAYPWIARNRYRLPAWLAQPLFTGALQRSATGSTGSACGPACRVDR